MLLSVVLYVHVTVTITVTEALVLHPYWKTDGASQRESICK